MHKESKRLRPLKAAGPDGILPKVLRICSSQLCEIFCTIFNLSFLSGVVPDIWKSSCIIPVPKNDKVGSMNNLRPVELTSVALKTCERIVLPQLKSFTAYIDIRRIISIRHLLCIDATKIMLSAIVLLKLYYCNSLFYGSPMYMQERFQKVQNSAARLILQCRKQNHISPLLMSLHWLPINVRIEYKLSVICHSFFLGLSPTYLSDLLLVHTPNETYTLLLIIKFYVSINCEQRHLGIAHFYLQPPQYGIPFLQSSDILIPSRNLS